MMIDLIPAIDLQQGQCVRLHQGNFASTTHYPLDPIGAAKRYAEQDIDCIHIVDLDGAQNPTQSQANLILQPFGIDNEKLPAESP